MDTAREHEVVRFQPRLLDPLLHGITGGRRDLELHRALGIVLHHHGAGCDLVAMANVPHFEADEVTAAKLAVDSQVEESKLAHPTFHLEASTNGLDVLELERCLPTDDLALVPRLAMNSVELGSHDGLPLS